MYVLKSQKKSADPSEHQPLILNTTGRKIYSKSEAKDAINDLSSMLEGLKVDSGAAAAASSVNDNSKDMDIDT